MTTKAPVKEPTKETHAPKGAIHFNPAIEAPEKLDLCPIISTQLASWAQHKSGERDGEIAYFRLNQVREIADLDSRGEITSVAAVATSVGSGLPAKGAHTDDLVGGILSTGLINKVVIGIDKIGPFFVDGRRRHAALSSFLDPTAIVAFQVFPGSVEEAMLASAVANVNRKDITVPALADFLARFEERTKLPQTKIAEKVGFHFSYVSNLIRIASRMTPVDMATWRKDPSKLDVKAAVSRVAASKDPKEVIQFFETGGGSNTSDEAKTKAAKEKRGRVNSLAKILDESAPAALAAPGLSGLTPEQWEMVYLGMRTARGEATRLSVETTGSGNILVAMKADPGK